MKRTYPGTLKWAYLGGLIVLIVMIVFCGWIGDRLFPARLLESLLGVNLLALFFPFFHLTWIALFMLISSKAIELIWLKAGAEQGAAHFLKRTMTFARWVSVGAAAVSILAKGTIKGWVWQDGLWSSVLESSYHKWILIPTLLVLFIGGAAFYLMWRSTDALIGYGWSRRALLAVALFAMCWGVVVLQ